MEKSKIMRLTAFRSDEEWLLLFEMPGYTKNHEFIDEICAFGNGLKKQGFAFENPVLLEEKQDEPFYGEKGMFLLSPSSCDLIFRGNPTHLAFSEEDYRRAGVSMDSKSPAPAVLLRLLAESMGEELYEQAEELLRIIGREKAGLRVFLRLKHWHHPDLAEEELPSQSISLSSLAKALEDNNSKAYHCPPEEVNSFWCHWGEEHNGWE